MRNNEKMILKVKELISQMTLEEKASQLLHKSRAIEHLDIPAYCWWNEALHGIAQGKATVFPQAIGLAATFDIDLMQRIGDAIADEARARHHNIIKTRPSECYEGLTFWAPNINIFRDPRWGRGMETFGEDPFLTGELGKAYVTGMQGDDSDRLKVSACAKHFAVHSGPEHLRHEFNAVVSQADMDETYLPAFKKLVKAGVSGIMGAYNRTNGEVCCGSKTLLRDILRDEWNFEGYIVSDCWAISDFHEFHKVTSTPAESVALALKNSCNLNCGITYQYLLDAVEQGLISEADIDESLVYLLKIRYRLGMFDAEYKELYKKYPLKLINCDKHRDLALEAAHKSIVLLENKDNTLPLDQAIQSLFITGPMAARIDALIGNYYGVSEHYTTILEGIMQKLDSSTRIVYHPCCYPAGKWKSRPKGMINASTYQDVTIAVMGLDLSLEGEEGESFESRDGDRLQLSLPEVQLNYLKELRQLTRENDKKLVLILTGGSPIILPDDIADAILFVWYPGEAGGEAVADILFGIKSPSGKLPLSFPVSEEQLPPFQDYAMENRTYRFMQSEPRYSFGYGLSYTKFEYADFHYTLNEMDFVGNFKITNVGKYDSDEVCQIYVIAKNKSIGKLRKQLVWFEKVELKAGESQVLQINENMKEFDYLLNGEFEFILYGNK